MSRSIAIKTLYYSILAVSLLAMAGCQGRATIPPSATLEQGGRGGLSYTADRTGNVYILDADKNEKVFEGHMNHGDQIVVDPGRDRIVLAGNNAPHDIGLKPDHKYEIYFTPQEP